MSKALPKAARDLAVTIHYAGSVLGCTGVTVWPLLSHTHHGPQNLCVTKEEPFLPPLSQSQAPHLHLEQGIATQVAPGLLLPEETQLSIQVR